jgi:hypothetical protein
MSKNVFDQLTEELEEVLGPLGGKAEPFRLDVPPYDLVMLPDDSGTFYANVPAFPEVVAYGATVEEARANTHRTIGGAIVSA